MSNITINNGLVAALQWYIDNGVTDTLLDVIVDNTDITVKNLNYYQDNLPKYEENISEESLSPAQQPRAIMDIQKQALLGKSNAYEEAIRLLNSVKNLKDLKDVIVNFDGIALKRTAMNMVFSDGNPNADIMIIGDAPLADDDRIGTPFSGEQGKLLDKMLNCIDLDRNSVYLSNILNWRPPGGRSPTPSEIEISLPFIEKHIQIINPKILMFLGGNVGKTLLGRNEGLSRLRKKWHDYIPQTKNFNIDNPIPAIVTYSLSALIKTPSQKKAAWDDLLMLQSLHKSK